MRSFLVILGLVISTAPAIASGGLSCTAEGHAVNLAIESGVTHGMGSPIFNFNGRLEILDKAVAEDLRETAFKGEHVAQYWLDQASLKLLLYREREGDKPHGYVELTIETQAGDEEQAFNGPYRLTVFDVTGDSGGEGKTVKFEGQAYCFAE